MKLKNLAIITMAAIFISGCSVSIGGGSKSSKTKKQDIVYDCSEISDQAHKEMTERYNSCSSGDTVFGQECREQVIRSVCKPIIKSE